MGSLAPKFTVHLGDLTHPVPSMAAYSTAVEDFRKIITELKMPLYLVPGNHDVGDKPVDWAPAGVVRERFLAAWSRNFGSHYQSFSHGGVKFILLNAQIINSGLELEHQQRTWLESTLKTADGERIMLLLHYPPYIYTEDEAENYDNLAITGRTWLLDLSEKYNVEALFAGHVHHFWYNRYKSMDCYLLPSTSFTRQDYSEMFRVAPAEQMADGRNDSAKVGYFVVLVYENGHVCHFRSTKGSALQSAEEISDSRKSSQVIPLHPREAKTNRVGFDMRHPWAEVVEIAPSGALDEFSRKRVRNDYPLFALWQMGTGLMRIPTSDLEDSQTVVRMQALQELGHAFVITSDGVPDESTLACMIRCKDLINRWEIAIPIAKIDELKDTLRSFKSETRLPIYLSKLRMKSDRAKDGEPYYHHISHGFSVADEDEINSLMKCNDPRKLFEGVVFRIARPDSVSKSLTEVAAICERLGVGASVTMFMADPNPAKHRCDDHDTANRIAESVFSAASLGKVELFVDTFIDLDRGHSVRNGVIDRLCNPRPAMFVVQNLNAILNSEWDVSGSLSYGTFDNGRWVCANQPERSLVLIAANAPNRRFELSIKDCQQKIGGVGQVLNLVSGKIEPISIITSDTGIVLESKESTSGPLLILSQRAWN